MKPGNSHSNSPAVLATLGVSLLSLPVLMKWAWLLPLQLCRETVATSWDSMEHKAGRQADSQLGPSRSHCGGLRCVLFGSVQQEAVPQSPRLALWWQTRLGAFLFSGSCCCSHCLCLLDAHPLAQLYRALPHNVSWDYFFSPPKVPGVRSESRATFPASLLVYSLQESRVGAPSADNPRNHLVPGGHRYHKMMCACSHLGNFSPG